MDFATFNALHVHHKILPCLFYAIIALVYYLFPGTIATDTSTLPKRYRLATKLIHIGSISPCKNYYNINTTYITEPAAMKHPTGGNDGYEDDGRDTRAVASVLLPDDLHVAFLVNISIGKPSVPQLLVMDTGSSLSWTQCHPCVRCVHQVYTPIFNPSHSSSYRVFPCGDELDPTCSNLVRTGQCSHLSGCVYSMNYVDGTNSTGVLGIDSFTFFTDTGVEPIGTIHVPDVVFGCGRDNHNLGSGFTGVLGLGPDDISLVSQLGTKFSYCIGSLYDPHYTYNHLIIGEDAITSQGYSTPMEIHDGHYYLTLEKIMVGETTLNIDPKIFKRSKAGNGGLLIDSGMTFTYLTREAYKVLRGEVEKLMEGVMKRLRNSEDLCYKGSVERDLKGFPAVTFRFSGEADLVLGADSMFTQKVRHGRSTLCMAVKMSETREGLGGLNAIGLLAQQYYSVGYDLDAMKISFLGIDCQLLLA